MENMPRQSRLLSAIGALLALCVMAAPAQAADCPRAGNLGTSRVLTIDPQVYPRVGLKSFPQTLPLRDHEVVLTFDDGPSPLTTPKVLAALANECVHATFFLIGEHSADHPDLVRRIAAEGNIIGHHTWDHPSLPKISLSQATDQIEHGIAVDEM